MHRTYDTFDEMYRQMLLDVLSEGEERDSRVGGSREVVGWSGCLADPHSNFLLNERRRMSPQYAAAEVLHHLSFTRDVRMLLPYAPQYEKWSEEDGTMHGAYGGRWKNQVGFLLKRQSHEDRHDVKFENQLQLALQLLHDRPNTRQCVVTTWDSSDFIHALEGDKRNLPCSVMVQLMLREFPFDTLQLDMLAYVRSNDLWLGVPYDVFAFTCVQKLLADALDACLEDVDVVMGEYHHSVGSLHVYDEHEDRAREAVGAKPLDVEGDDHHWFNEFQAAKIGELPSLARHTEHYLELERLAREGELRAADVEVIAEQHDGKHAGMLMDLVLLCWSKLAPGFNPEPHLRSEVLGEAYACFARKES